MNTNKTRKVLRIRVQNPHLLTMENAPSTLGTLTQVAKEHVFRGNNVIIEGLAEFSHEEVVDDK